MTAGRVEQSDPWVSINPNAKWLRTSATLAINEESKRLSASGRKIYKLGFGQSPFPVPKLVVRALEQNAAERSYLQVNGLPELREAVSGFHKRLHNLDYDANEVFIGPGSKELMFGLQLILDCEVLLASPSWVSYEPQARVLGKRTVWLPTTKRDGWQLSAETIENYCSGRPREPRLLILNYPGNPSGTTIPRQDLVEIAEVARRNRLIVLSDEIYGELDHSGKHSSIGEFYREGTIVSSGLSKWCGAGGWRLGTFCIPNELSKITEQLEKFASETFSAVSAPIQYAAVTAFGSDEDLVNYRNDCRSILSALGTLVSKRLNAMGAQTPASEGGFYLFPDFEVFHEGLKAAGIETSRRFCSALLEETGVALLPGSEFGRPAGEFTCRLAYVDFDGKKTLAELGAERIVDERFIHDHCNAVLEALDITEAWLSKYK